MSSSQCSECGGTVTAREEPLDLSAAPDSPHHSFLHSNEAPGDSDSTIVRSMLSKARKRLAVVERELTRRRERMQALKEERASLSGYLTENNAILSPLRRILPEVLGEIFSWTLPSIHELRQEDSGVRDSPWVLTHISSRWRTVALSTPSL
ncbi:hypothetical protein C8R44DRAFT_619933 [Mycena epipterygia]|nr:hypothetical protein C8R44DRAFT_619933 [Mycena epipterygia]